ncbi:MAG: papain-like cysteine protease family protein [Lachnospiraceae bacterium]|nr:papain-like cysteine protease family protein [Lachnospiraceae bacterium]
MYTNEDQEQEQSKKSSQIPDNLNNILKQANKNSNPNTSSPETTTDNNSNTTSNTPKSSSTNSVNAGSNVNPSGITPGTSSASSVSGVASTTGAGGTASAGTVTAGTAGTGIATGAGTATGATATGAAVGSVVPVAGTAIGAAAGGATGVATNKAAKNLSDKGAETVGVATPTGGNQKNTAGTVDTGAAKIVSIIIAILFVIVYFLAINTLTITKNLVAPIFFIWEQTQNPTKVPVEYAADIGIEEPTYEDICKVINKKLQTSIEKAYYETCSQEVQQIAIEKNYDMELTMESYNSNTFPYVLEGTNCNINYAEILLVMSMQQKYDISYVEFNYNEFIANLDDEKFLRSLYTLDVERAEKNIPNENNIGYNTVVYGKVTVGRYSLKHIFECFDIDPYAYSKMITSVTNYKSLDYQEYHVRNYYPNEHWGCTKRSELLDYKVHTGQLTPDSMLIYPEDINKQPIISNNSVFMDVEIFKQSGQSWSQESYGESGDSIAKIGCCLTAMSMVCNYFSDEYVTPHVLNTYIKATNGGLLNRRSVAKHYGFQQHKSVYQINLAEMMNELEQGHLIIIHIRSGAKGTGKYGHWVVLNGYHVSDTESYFNVCEPASRLKNTISMSEAVLIFDQYQTYGK